jgi:hypothetical protein
VTARDQGGSVVAAPLTVKVPPDAKRIELWFQNTDNTGVLLGIVGTDRTTGLTSIQFNALTLRADLFDCCRVRT